MNMPWFSAPLAASLMVWQTSLAQPSSEAWANIAYDGIYDKPVQMVNGLYEGEPFVAGGASRPRAELLGELQATDDIDGDGTEDVWVLLNENSGGTGQLLYLAAVANARGEARNIGTIGIGDRVDIMGLSAAEGSAKLQYVTTAPGEPACCPTQMVSASFAMQDGRLVELGRKDLGTLDLEHLAGGSWRLARFDRNEPVPEGVEITAAFDNGRISGSAGCNRYFAEIKAPNPYALAIGPAGATRMACPPPQMEAEDRYLRALDMTKQFSFVMGRLAISYTTDGGVRSLIFERSEEK
jgi:heat shock protein HslJ